MELNDTFTQLWVIWLGLFGVVEGVALFNKKPGDTFSTHIWKFLGLRGYALPSGYKWRRGGVLVFLSWLIGHFLYGVM